MTPAVLLADAIAEIRPLDATAGAQVQRALDNKTKPRGSLGRMEDLAVWLAGARGSTTPRLDRKAIVVAAADHGVTAAGVSAYPADVTFQMLANFAAGGAAINALARQAGAELLVVDVGVNRPTPGNANILDRRVRAGTANMLAADAMSVDEALACVGHGIALADKLAEDGVDAIGLGEMGIGNTTAASALTAALLNLPPVEVTGRGTGLDDAGLARKIAAIEAALAARTPDPTLPLETLAKIGGLEIGFLAGLCLGAAANRIPVVLDGFITGAAALIAARLAPGCRDYYLAAHVSVERGHARILADLGLKPLLDFDLRLGEGTGAALALPILDAALRILNEMATFGEAGVSDTGR